MLADKALRRVLIATLICVAAGALLIGWGSNQRVVVGQNAPVLYRVNMLTGSTTFCVPAGCQKLGPYSPAADHVTP